MSITDREDATASDSRAADRAAGHALLLRFAGRLPDAELARFRAETAGEAFEPGTFAARLATAVTLADAGVAGADRDLLASLVGAGGADPGLLDGVPLRDGHLFPPFRFAPAPPALLRTAGDRIDACLDLTCDPDASTAPDLLDIVDRAAMTAVGAVGGAVGLWRAHRFARDAGLDGPARRVFLLEVGIWAAPWSAAAALQSALDEAGEAVPLVEAFQTGDSLPVYQNSARSYSALLWAAEPAVPVRVAEVFDRESAEGLGEFDPGHPIVPLGDERDLLLAHLESGTMLAATDALLPDVVEPARGTCVPVTVRTDGVWIWTDTVTYYLRRYGLSPDPGLLEHIRQAAEPPHGLDGVAVFRSLRRLYRAEDVQEPPRA